MSLQQVSTQSIPHEIALLAKWATKNIINWVMLDDEKPSEESIFLTLCEAWQTSQGDVLQEIKPESFSIPVVNTNNLSLDIVYAKTRAIIASVSQIEGFKGSRAYYLLNTILCNAVAVRHDGQAFDLFVGRAVTTSLKQFHLEDLFLVDYAPGFRTVVAGWCTVKKAWGFSTISRDTIAADRNRFSLSRGQVNSLTTRTYGSLLRNVV